MEGARKSASVVRPYAVAMLANFDNHAGVATPDITATTERQPLSYEDMFKATGGIRLGMRARASQKGKWARTESGEAVSARRCVTIVYGRNG